MLLKLYRRYIADQVEDKMARMCCCPNERDILLRIIDPIWHREDNICHCKIDCWSTTCLLSKNFKQEDFNATEEHYRGNDISRGSQKDSGT